MENMLGTITNYVYQIGETLAGEDFGKYLEK